EARKLGRPLHEPSLSAEPAAAPETGGQLVGTCPAMRQVYKEIGLVAVQDFPVIITGESGTGKELVARAIHEHSNRAGRPFLALNAAAIRADQGVSGPTTWHNQSKEARHDVRILWSTVHGNCSGGVAGRSRRP